VGGSGTGSSSPASPAASAASVAAAAELPAPEASEPAPSPGGGGTSMAQRGPLTLYLPQFTARGKLFFISIKMYNYIAPCIPNLAISCIVYYTY